MAGLGAAAAADTPPTNHGQTTQAFTVTTFLISSHTIVVMCNSTLEGICRSTSKPNRENDESLPVR
eukprot:5484129-Prymnesium_polylepis.3